MSVATVQIPNPAFHGDYDTPRPVGLLSAVGPTYLTVRLGRIAPKARPFVPRLASYMPAAAPTPPAETNRRAKAMDSIRRMYLNDQYGDCVIAGKYHNVGLWTGNDTLATVVGTDQEVYQQYQQICGPGDNGCMVTAVLDVFKARGLPFNGVKYTIDGYVAVDWSNKLEVQVAVYLFGALTLAIDLPAEWANNPTIWDGAQTNIVGGHDISIVDYNADGVVVSTWGGTRLLTWSALTRLNRNTELYAMLAPSWYNDDKLAPNGINVEKLKADLEIIGGNTLPDIDPDVPPIPPSPPTPPTPPVPPAPPSFPEYAVALRGWFGTMTGTASPIQGHATGLVAGVNWLSLIQHAFQLVRHVQAQQWDIVDDDILAILADLGISLSQSRMLSPDQWQQLVQAVIAFALALLKAFGKL